MFIISVTGPSNVSLGRAYFLSFDLLVEAEPLILTFDKNFAMRFADVEDARCVDRLFDHMGYLDSRVEEACLE